MRGVDERWRHIRSPHFELYTHNAEYESRTLLHDLELLRALFLERFKLVERSRTDVTVYAFRRAEDFEAYAGEGLPKEVRGFYLTGPDRAVINLAPIDDWEQAQRLVFHEYVHHLFRVVEQEPPLWFNEGMAELLAAIREESGQLEIGRPHAGRIATLRTEKLLPLETLFAVDHGSPIYRSKDHTGIFYAQSWALLHYWYFGDSGLPKDAVTRFTRIAGEQRLAEQVDLRRFFRECFSMDYPEMQRRLERYVTGGQYRFGREAVPKIAPASSYEARAVSRDEIRVRLAELAVRVNRSAMGKFVLVDAAATGGKDVRVLEALGANALAENDPAKAIDWWEQALVAGSTNPALVRELSLLETRDWFRDFDYYFRLPPATVERLRQRLRRAIEHEPLQTTAYELLAWVEAFAEVPHVPNVNLVQREFKRLKQKQRTVLALALVRLHSGMKEEAMELLKEVDGLEWDAWAAQSAEVVRAKLEDRPVRMVRAPLGENETMVEMTSDLRGFLRYPSVVLPEKR